MKTIWKFQLDLTDTCTVEMPEGAEILTVQAQYEQPCLWAVVDSDAEKVARVFQVYGTGHPMIDQPNINHEFIGTFQIRGGSLVFHVFELTGTGIVSVKQTPRLN